MNIKGLENIKALAPDALVYYVIIPPKGLTPTIKIPMSYLQPDPAIQSDPAIRSDLAMQPTPAIRPPTAFSVFHLPIADQAFSPLP